MRQAESSSGGIDHAAILSPGFGSRIGQSLSHNVAALCQPSPTAWVTNAKTEPQAPTGRPYRARTDLVRRGDRAELWNMLGDQPSG